MERPDLAEEISPCEPEWKTVTDPKQAARLFVQTLLHKNKDSQRLFLCVDIRQDKAEQDRALVSFFKRDNIQWASPLYCKLQGDIATGTGVDRHMMSMVIFKLISGFHINLGSSAVTKIFEGQPDHLVPSVSEELLTNDMFAVAGRMIGYSFLHNGPSFPGLSPAILHILFEGSVESAPVTSEDCPDLDIRDTVTLLQSGGDADLNKLESIHQLCSSWKHPAPSDTNREWLSEKLLLHAVVERTMSQINQFRKGLQETGLWPLLKHRQDVIPILFPRESEAQLTPQMLLDCIVWPSSITVFLESNEAEEEDERDAVDVQRVSGYLKAFIESSSSAELKSLARFWIGWEVPASEMKVEIVDAILPTSSTCFEKLRLPRHYKTYSAFHQDLCACISSSYSGFGRA